ncbi:MAG: MATE family efflux transporter [Clostridia bacterium]|nr:MATE family efflux transporter [Clostridia bacterium]
MDKTEAKYIRLTTQPVFKLLCALSAPAIVGMLITAIYNAADSYFVSRINDSAVGSIGVIFSFMAIIQAVGFMCGHGAGNFMSRELGKKNYEDSGKIAVTGVVIAFCIGGVLAVGGLCFLDPLAMFLGSTETILPYARDYLRFILIAAPFQTAALTLNNELRFQGNARQGMIGIGFGAVLNMGLDPLLISVVGLGVSGAGISTMVSQIVSFFLLVFFTFRGGNMPLKLNRFSPTGRFLKEIFRGGIPSFGRQVIGSVATILLNYALKPYGDNAIAAMAVVSKVSMIVLSVVIGLGQGFQPLCGMNYGAKKYGRVLKAFTITVLSSTVVLVLGALVGFLFTRPVISFFASEEETVVIGVKALRLQMLPAVFSAFYLIGSMMLQNLGKSLRATVLAISRQGIMFMPLILILPRFFGLTGALVAQPVSDFLSFLIGVPLVVSQVRELRALQKAQDDCA